MQNTIPTAPEELLPARTVRVLIDRIDRYLADLPGPGVADVRAGIAAWRGRAVAMRAVSANAVADAQLAPALAALRPSHADLATAIDDASPYLDWITYDRYPPEAIGPTFVAGHAFCSIIGPQAPILAEDFEVGLFVIAPDVLYRDHCHRAPELYAPLTGPHGWRFGPGQPLTLQPAHVPVWNEPYAPHLTKVGAVPFLSIYGWLRDINEPASVLPASDWAELEALRLGRGF